MDRRRSLAALAALATAGLRPARAQAPARIPRVAFLNYGSRANFATRAEAFVKAMTALGYVESRTVAYDYRVANGQEDLLAAYAAEIGRSGAAVVVSASTHTTRALLAARIPTPVVMGAADDPVAEGFVKSLERPGGTITGVHATVLDKLERHVELLFAAAPRLTRVTALLNPMNPTSTPTAAGCSRRCARARGSSSWTPRPPSRSSARSLRVRARTPTGWW